MNHLNKLELDDLPSSRRASRASPSQLRAAVKDMMTSVIYGPKSQECFARLDPNGSWVKTSGDYSLFETERSTAKFSETWPTWGTVSDGGATELMKPRDFRIAGIESSLLDTWPTATVMSGSQTAENPTPKQTGGTILAGAAENWATPRAMKTGGAGGIGFSVPLPEQAETWVLKFPAQSNTKNGKNCSPSGPTLLPHSPERKRLNYRFVQSLMGFPEEWL